MKIYKSSLYQTWYSMKRRCLNPNDPSYKHYGGRGIKICDSWMNDFFAFKNDMGCKPSSKHSIDRINNDGNYEPSNCRWATARQQCNNTRFNYYIAYKGKRISISDLARKLKLCTNTIRNYISQGLDIEKEIIAQRNFARYSKIKQRRLLKHQTEKIK